jgi:hypothetical protein
MFDWMDEYDEGDEPDDDVCDIEFGYDPFSDAD